ncbi:MAG: YbgC/FadM family acyl-CoA thioesterase [Candidatus Omnitrophota bacterium]|nr:YbgC/FadM family acyl-CoA thioesterase [Candidatus Omnitrophota bacterium]
MADHYIDKKMYYHDTDAGGVVYYARYLEHLEEGRFEFCLSKGVNIAESAKEGAIFPVVHFEIDYKSPARYGDQVRIFTSIEKTGFSSIHFLQEIKKGDMALIKAKTVLACVNEALKPRAIPDKIKQALKKA